MKSHPKFDEYLVLNEYRNDNGNLHREDGPAAVWRDGSAQWWIDGKRHRLDGPAVVQVNGINYWYLDGDSLNESEFNNHPLVIMNRFVNGT